MCCVQLCDSEGARRWLAELDSDPTELVLWIKAHCQKGASARLPMLGMYFSVLIRFWLVKCPESPAADLKINSQVCCSKVYTVVV